MTEKAQNADLRRKPHIFADSPLLLEIHAFGGRRKPQRTADFRRKPQICAENRRKSQIGLRRLRSVTFSSALVGGPGDCRSQVVFGVCLSCVAPRGFSLRGFWTPSCGGAKGLRLPRSLGRSMRNAESQTPFPIARGSLRPLFPTANLSRKEKAPKENLHKEFRRDPGRGVKEGA